MRWDDYFLWFVGLGLVLTFTIMSVTGCATVRKFPHESEQLDVARNSYLVGCVEALREVRYPDGSRVIPDEDLILSTCQVESVRYSEILRSKNPR